MENEIQDIKKHLERIINNSKVFFEESSPKQGFNLKPDMTAGQTWSLLSSISDEDFFVNNFNKLDESKRKEVAEHVLSKCNIFSGKAFVFSSRYNNESGLME